MKPILLLQICLIITRSTTLTSDKRLNNIITALYSRRSFSVRKGHRRAKSSPATPFFRRYSVQTEISQSCSTRKVIKPFILANIMAFEQRRLRNLQDPVLSLDTVMTSNSNMAVGASSTVEPAPSSDASTSTRAHRAGSIAGSGYMGKDTSSSLMSSPPSLSETSQTRSTRSTSTTSRNSNRLSLTLPIAAPNSFPSRPTPTASMPPTPIETSALSSPTDPNDFIIAIAAQERRVLELREELSRAEHELRKLKKQWTTSDAYKKRGTNRNIDPLRARAPAPEVQWGHDDSPAVRYTSELERRKAILLAQSQAAPREHKRTVIRGGHTRALSLLSPTKPANGDDGGLRSADPYSKPEPVLSPAPLNKRATWAPRQSLPANGMKQMANELKQGLWTFVEDLRQATVGDEGISGTTNRTSDMPSHDQDTIRASTTTRGRMPFQDEPESLIDAPGRSSTGSFSDRFQHRRTESRQEPSKAKKHYSWTPLTFDNYDDEDWSNWDTPNVKTSRWSGSTVNGDIISPIRERNNENEGTL